MCSQQEPCRLLIIEDDPYIVNLLKDKLKRGDFFELALECVIATNLAEGIEAIRSNPPFDVISVDPKLPFSADGDTYSEGVSTYDAIRKEAQEPDIFIYTGHLDSGFVDVVIRRGAERVLMKGKWSIDQYLMLLHYAAGQYRAKLRWKREAEYNRACYEREARNLEVIRNRVKLDNEATRELDLVINNMRQKALAAG
jgi:CheY-like chemotaxis protein